MQIRHGPLAQLGGRGQLEQRRRVGALSRDREHTGPSRDPGGDGGGLHVSGDRRHAMACEEAQELHCFGAEPAADLDADHNESTAPRALEFRVGLEALAPCSGRHCASRLHVGARVGFAASGEGETMVASSASCEAVPKGEAVGDDLDAPLIGDRNVQVHVREPDVACHSGASFTAYPRDGVLEGQRAGGQKRPR